MVAIASQVLDPDHCVRKRRLDQLFDFCRLHRHVYAPQLVLNLALHQGGDCCFHRIAHV